MVAVWAFDVLASVVLASTALIGAYVPVVLAHKGRATGERSLPFILGNMLSAGVMIAAGFCELLGDAIEQLSRSFKYPLAPFLCACGFMSTLVADQVVDAANSRQPAIPVLAEGELPMLTTLAAGDTSSGGLPGISPRGGSGQSGHGHGGGHHRCFGAMVQQVSSAATARQQQQQRRRRGRVSDASANGNNSEAANADEEIVFGDEEEVSGKRRSGDGSMGQQHRSQWSGRRNGCYTLSPGSEAGSDLEAPDDEFSDFEAVSEPVSSQMSFLTVCLMGVALTFHSLLEGVALGAQADMANSLHIFIAIQAHKGLSAYAVGSSIVDSDAQPGQFWSVIVTLALATPVGIAIGALLESWTTSNGAAAISALSSGTFLYVAFMEVLPRELSSPKHRLPKLAMLMLGFILTALLAVWA